MKREVVRKTAAELRREYPIDDRLEGWFFRVQEVSAGVYLVEGSDYYGRLVSRTGTEPDPLLEQCVTDAGIIQAQLLSPGDTASRRRAALYSPGQVAGATFLGGPIAGALALYLNEELLGRTARSPRLLGIGCAATLGLIALSVALEVWLPEAVRVLDLLLAVACAAIAMEAARRLQGEDYDAFVKVGGAARSLGSVLLIGLGCRFAILLLVLTLAALFGAVSADLEPARRLPEPLARPESVVPDTDGRIRHPAAFAFEPSYGSFVRSGARRFDSEGSHLEVSYELANPICPVTATFSVYPLDLVRLAALDRYGSDEEWVEREYRRLRSALAPGDPMGVPRSEGPVTSAAGPGALQGRGIVVREQGSLSELRVFLYRQEWFVTYRFTYPVVCEPDAVGALEGEILPALPWTTEP